MLNGLRSAFRRNSSDSAHGGLNVRSSAELDKWLPEDAKTRKKSLSQFCWFFEQIKTRNAAEGKLKQSCGMF
jgi:hypothetical protein